MTGESNNEVCSQLVNILDILEGPVPEENFTCLITGSQCNSVSIERTCQTAVGRNSTLHYDNEKAKKRCPAYNISDERAAQLRQDRLNAGLLTSKKFEGLAILVKKYKK